MRNPVWNDKLQQQFAHDVGRTTGCTVLTRSQVRRLRAILRFFHQEWAEADNPGMPIIKRTEFHNSFAALQKMGLWGRRGK